MKNSFIKYGITFFVLLAAVFLSSCSMASSKIASDEGNVSTDSGGEAKTGSASTDFVSSVVDFNHELDQYKPKKDRYNFYFTYKTVHPWWDAVALGMEDAQRQYLERGITITYEYMAPEVASAEDQKKSV